MTGSLQILNVGAGDVSVKFETQADLAKGAEIVKRCLKEGFAVLVELPDGSFQRVVGFDEATASYQIAVAEADFGRGPTAPAAATDESPTGRASGENEPSGTAPKPRGRPRRQPVPMKSAKAVAVAASAGG